MLERKCRLVMYNGPYMYALSSHYSIILQHPIITRLYQTFYQHSTNIQSHYHSIKPQQLIPSRILSTTVMDILHRDLINPTNKD